MVRCVTPARSARVVERSREERLLPGPGKWMARISLRSRPRRSNARQHTNNAWLESAPPLIPKITLRWWVCSRRRIKPEDWISSNRANCFSGSFALINGKRTGWETSSTVGFAGKESDKDGSQTAWTTWVSKESSRAASRHRPFCQISAFPEKTWSVVDSLAPAEQITVMPSLAAGSKAVCRFSSAGARAGRVTRLISKPVSFSVGCW